MRYLAFDYGTEYSGIAVGGDLSSSAEPLAPLAMNNGWADEEQLNKLITEWSPDAFVLGMPATPEQAKADDAKTAQPINLAKRVRSFSAYLQRKFDRPYHFIDERLSSQVMEQKMKDMGVKPEAGTLDSMVACALLYEWLDRQDKSDGTADADAMDSKDSPDNLNNLKEQQNLSGANDKHATTDTADTAPTKEMPEEPDIKSDAPATAARPNADTNTVPTKEAPPKANIKNRSAKIEISDDLFS